MKIVIIADDFTGAAEAAGVGYRHGLPAEVAFRAVTDGAAALAIDTDTRLCRPAAARLALRAEGEKLTRLRGRLIFKKVDSVLRGNVYAESVALAKALGKAGVILVPANPTMGRIIKDGRYYIGGIPVARTFFRDDPHHPIRDSRIGQMLGAADAVVVRRTGDGARSGEFTVGEAACEEDLRYWARQVNDRFLPVGGAEFLAAVIQAAGRTATKPAFLGPPCSPALWIAGSASEVCRSHLKKARERGAPVFGMPRPLRGPRWLTSSPLVDWMGQIQGALSASPLVAAAVGENASAPRFDTSRGIREGFATLAEQLWHLRAYRHLMIEGGATAAAILRRLGWTRLLVANEWSPGVVSLHPSGARDILVTVKPGSYAWPKSLLSFVNS